jgi:hypothetical protein
MTKSRPVIVTMSALAAAQAFTATAAFTDAIPAKTAALIVAAVAAIQIGVQFYVQSAVTPAQDVVAFRNREGDVVPGALAADSDKAAAAVTVLTTPPAE